MKKNFTQRSVTFTLALGGLLLAACSPDAGLENLNEVDNFKTLDLQAQSGDIKIDTELPALEGYIFNDVPFNFANAVEPSACAPTAFDEVIDASINSNLDYYGSLYYNTYASINQIYSIINQDEQYFGAEGQYTNYVAKRKRELEKFWDMSALITLHGQHNSTLNDVDKIAQAYMAAGYPESSAYANANAFLQINEISTFLIESPLLSFDGFASSSDLIVIGDGIVELASKAGIEDKIVWSGILSHEWAHQIQFDNMQEWYPNGAADNAPEDTRTTELEADFFAAYYMTHKRGATYNWKRVQDFLELYFNIGDCSFTSSGHHGTPEQRMRSAEAGYELASSTFPKGKILSPDEVHELFLESLDDIVSGN
tara:strand:- start:148537 stop:149643 length:1107 start_codon:yes stop_codon:yes gene_type:complete